jgi:hypothetical protein
VTRRPSVTTAAYLLMVFLSGALVGAFAYRLYMVNTVISETRPPRNPEEYRRRYVEEMTTRLKLSTDQVGQLQAIMDRTRQRMNDVRERSMPLFKALETEQYEQVRAILDETQRAEYENMRAERERRRKEGHGGKDHGGKKPPGPVPAR